MDWITPEIAIGTHLEVADLPHEVTALLCLKEACCDAGRVDVEVCCVPLRDGPGNDPRRVREAVDFFAEMAASGERVLVHCHAGRSRSVVIVARYLMESRRLTRQAALAHIAARREIYLSDGILEMLEG